MTAEERSAYMKRYNEEHREQRKQNRRYYYLHHREEAIERSKEWIAENKERYNEYQRRYAEEHRDQINANARRRYLKPENYDKIRARQKEYYQRRKEKKNET